MNEQLSVVRIEVVTDSGIFSDDLAQRCCVEGKQKGTLGDSKLQFEQIRKTRTNLD